MSILVILPVSVVQGTDLSGLQPAGDTVEMECVVTHTPGHSALLATGRGLVSLTLNAGVHNVVPTDGTVVHYDIPSP